MAAVAPATAVSLAAAATAREESGARALAERLGLQFLDVT